MIRGGGLVSAVLGVALILSACGDPDSRSDTQGWDDAASRINGRTTFLAFRSVVVDSVLEGCDPAGRCTRATLALVTFPDAS